MNNSIIPETAMVLLVMFIFCLLLSFYRPDHSRELCQSVTVIDSCAETGGMQR